MFKCKIISKLEDFPPEMKMERVWALLKDGRNSVFFKMMGPDLNGNGVESKAVWIKI